MSQETGILSSKSAKKTKIEGRITELLAGGGPVQPILDYLVATKGKMLRPALVMLTAEACAPVSGIVPQEDDVLDVAATFEMIHMASLIHDDIIDDAPRRRGMPTAHLLWGIHSAILAGDYLFTRANRTALRYSHLGIASLVCQAIELTCEGEIAQDARLYDPTVTAGEYISHIARKTATLFGAACQAGAAIAKAPPEIEDVMLRFGVEVGCAFQISDDIMDLTADPAVSGKPPLSDLRRGILTLPLIDAMGTPAGRLVEEAFRSKQVDDEASQTIKAACEREGCIDRARDDARMLARSASSRLAVLPATDAKAALVELAESVAAENK